MPVPARKKSNASGRRRRSHDALKPATTSVCSNCQMPLRPHRACTVCGFYQGRQVIKTKTSGEKLVKKAQKKTTKTPKA